MKPLQALLLRCHTLRADNLEGFEEIPFLQITRSRRSLRARWRLLTQEEVGVYEGPGQLVAQPAFPPAHGTLRLESLEAGAAGDGVPEQWL